MAVEAKSAGGARAPGSGSAADQVGASQERALRPSQCREYMRRELAREFRGIVQGFVKSAKAGSCQHVKLATELVSAPARSRTRVRSKGSAQLLLEKLEREFGS